MSRRIDMKGKRFGRLLVLRELPDRKRGEIVWLCECDCGNEVEVKGYNLRIGKTKSCGCLWDDLTIKNLTGKTFGKLKVKEMADYKFDYNASKVWRCECRCGGSIDVATQQLLNGRTRSCGCLRVEFLESQTGNKHHNYNPHLTDEERERLRGQDHVHWREKVFERDDFTCNICKTRGGKLNAHHLDGDNWCKDKRFDVDNGVALCDDCHKKFHTAYGYGNNTKKQYEEYKNARKAKALI